MATVCCVFCRLHFVISTSRKFCCCLSTLHQNKVGCVLTQLVQLISTPHTLKPEAEPASETSRPFRTAQIK